VAVDADPIGRQDVDELRVGMIGDVEQIELIGEPPGMAGEVDEPVEQPVGVERGVPSADGRQPGGEPAKRRAKAAGLDGERPPPRGKWARSMSPHRSMLGQPSSGKSVRMARWWGTAHRPFPREMIDLAA
jgi:hypothetical protein